MTRIVAASAALLATTAIAHAGGVERSSQSMAILFEEGTFVELSFGAISPEVTGVSAITLGPSPAGSTSGNMSPDYTTWALRYRQDITDNLSFAFIVDQPIGADVDYGPSAYLYGINLGNPGSQAEIDSNALSVILRYETANNFSVYGGLRAVEASGNVALFNGYTMSAEGSTELGYLLGVAYERPDIALRVALTYHSATDHDFAATENVAPGLPGFVTTIPQSLTLEAQSGIAPDTLLFGSIRWVDWSEFDITPFGYTNFVSPGNSLVDYDDDTITYNIGIGRRFNENWSGAITYTHEPSTGGFSGNLGPTDGRSAVGLGVTWTNDQVEITGGVQYSWIGDAVTEAPGIPGATYGVFNDNTALAAGMSIGFRF